MLSAEIMDRLGDGFTIMSIGMGVVFSFLVLMAVVLSLTSNVIKFLNKIFPEVAAEEKTSKQRRQGKDEEEIAVAIAAAVRNM